MKKKIIGICTMCIISSVCWGMEEKKETHKKKRGLSLFIQKNNKPNNNNQKKSTSSGNIIKNINDKILIFNFKKNKVESDKKNESPVITIPRENSNINEENSRANIHMLVNVGNNIKDISNTQRTIEIEKSPKTDNESPYKLVKKKSFIINKKDKLLEENLNTKEETKEYSKKLLQEMMTEYVLEEEKTTLNINDYIDDKIVKITKRPKKDDLFYTVLTYNMKTGEKKVTKESSFSEDKEILDENSMNVDLDYFLKNVKQPKQDHKEFAMEDESKDNLLIIEELNTVENNKKNTTLKITRRPKDNLNDTVFTYDCLTKKRTVFIENIVLKTKKETSEDAMDNDLDYLIKNLSTLKKEIEENGGCNIISMLTHLKIEQQQKNN